MSYNWDISKLKLHYLLAKLMHQKDLINYYKHLINEQDASSENFDKKDLLILDDIPTIDFSESLEYYRYGLDFIPEELYEDIIEIFSWFEDLNDLSIITKFEQIEMTNDELIGLAHDIISSMHNYDAIKLFNQLIKPRNNLLNIQEANNNTIGATDKVGGITYFNYYSKKSHVNIFRTHTIEDVESLVHESMHYIYNYLLHQYNKRSYIRLLGELEGIYGGIYTAHYLGINNISNQALDLRKEQINTVVANSFLLMMNHALFLTAKDESFDLPEAIKYVNNSLNQLELDITEDNLYKFLTVSGYDKTTESLSYLLALELINKLSPEEALQKIYDLKIDDTPMSIETLKKHNIHFIEDGYKDIIKEYKLTHKI